MKNPAYLWGAIVLCFVLTAVLFGRLVQSGADSAAALKSLKHIEAELAALKEMTPGLGEYMTTIQLHAGKMWFAAQASNWELAEYELDELKETMEAAKRLNAEKNGVKISGVLDSVLQTQVVKLDQSIKKKSRAEFPKSYDEMLGACNGCHAETGYKFIHIIRPSAPPVTNQRW
jgi:hypothetical protein